MCQAKRRVDSNDLWKTVEKPEARTGGKASGSLKARFPGLEVRGFHGRVGDSSGNAKAQKYRDGVDLRRASRESCERASLPREK
jgi:hypothetical protein